MILDSLLLGAVERCHLSSRVKLVVRGEEDLEELPVELVLAI